MIEEIVGYWREIVIGILSLLVLILIIKLFKVKRIDRESKSFMRKIRRETRELSKANLRLFKNIDDLIVNLPLYNRR